MSGRQLSPEGRSLPLLVAALIAVFLVAATWPYVWLIAHFGYDDILREPTPEILRAFHAGGAPLVAAWLAFAMSALLFIPLALALDRLAEPGVRGLPPAATLAIASAVAQCIGLLRWVLVVPGLSSAYVEGGASDATRASVVVVFEAVHHYGGMVIGEMVGQLLLAGWTVLAGWRLARAGVLPRWLCWAGSATVPLWVLGQTELLHQVVPSFPLYEVVPAAFMAWEAWLAALAVALVVQTLQRRRPPGGAPAPTACAS